MCCYTVNWTVTEKPGGQKTLQRPGKLDKDANFFFLERPKKQGKMSCAFVRDNGKKTDESHNHLYALTAV